MPVGIFLFEIDESFSPNLLAEYSVKQKGISKEILKTLADKHLEKSGLDYTTYRKDDLKYYSREIKLNDKDSLYLGFILKQKEFTDALTAISDELEKDIVDNYTQDKKQLKELLKEILNARIELREKLKEPKLIKDRINERTKKMLDDGKIQAARKLIDLGETIPDEMAEAVSLAEKAFSSKNFKEAKKLFSQAAELAKKIEEIEIFKVLSEKSKTAENYPQNLKKREDAYKKIKNLLSEIAPKEIFYQQAIDLIDDSITISDSIEDDLIIGELNDLIRYCNDCHKLQTKLKDKEKLVKDILNKI